MARAKHTSPPIPPAAVRLAQRLRAAVASDPEFAPDDLPAETPGVTEPGAIFHVSDAAGAIYRVRINRTN